MNTTFDLDTVIPRRNTGSYKWDSAEDPQTLPLWVADMDFRTAPAIIEALQKRVGHGIFGYTHVSEEYYEAVCRWFGTRHGLTIDPSWIIYTSGVVPTISAIIKALSLPGEKVITQTPAYNCFFSSIRNDGCQLASNPLLRRSDGTYHIDFEGLERLASDPAAKILILCNPHNPSGRCWTRKELSRIDSICRKNGVFVIADEIHCELTLNGNNYTPFASLSPEAALNSATCISPSKAFNIAGLQIANIVAPQPEIRRRIDRAININEVCDVNPFGIAATIAAYNHGAPWLDALKDYLWENYLTLRTRIADELPLYTLTPLEATYLAWLDITPSGLTSEQITDRLLENKLWLNPGTMYGPEGQGFIRINLATPRTLLNHAIDILVTTLKSL